MKQNPLDNLVLTKEEQKLEESLKIGHWSRIDTTNKWKKELQEMAKNTLHDLVEYTLSWKRVYYSNRLNT